MKRQINRKAHPNMRHIVANLEGVDIILHFLEVMFNIKKLCQRLAKIIPAQFVDSDGIFINRDFCTVSWKLSAAADGEIKTAFICYNCSWTAF